MKTLHRLMYEALEPDEYKEFCKEFDRLGYTFRLTENYVTERASDILCSLFIFDDTEKGHDYWAELAEELKEQGQ